MTPCEACGHVPGQPLRSGLLLKRARERLGWTQDQLLSAAGSEREVSWLSRLERTRPTIPKWEEWVALCEALGLDPAATAAGRRS